MVEFPPAAELRSSRVKFLLSLAACIRSLKARIESESFCKMLNSCGIVATYEPQAADEDRCLAYFYEGIGFFPSIQISQPTEELRTVKDEFDYLAAMYSAYNASLIAESGLDVQPVVWSVANSSTASSAPPETLQQTVEPMISGEAANDPSTVLTQPISPAATTESPPVTWPEDDGWHFRPGEAAYLGVPFTIRGKLHHLLREFVAANGSPRTWQELADAVSPKSDLLVGSVRAYVSKVRQILCETFDCMPTNEPIPKDEWGDREIAWRLKASVLKVRLDE